jgi:toxin HigB-1
MAIRSFRHRGLRRLYEEDDARGVPAEMQGKLTRMLTLLDAAGAPKDMGLYPGWRLHRLKGSRAGVWSLTVTGNWRLTFRMEDAASYDVDLVDYH